MQITLEVVLPIFGLIAVGFAVGRTALLGPEGVRGLSNFVFYVAIPALLFRTLSQGLPSRTLDWTVLFAYFGGAFATFAVAAAVGSLVFRLPVREAGLMGMGAGFANVVMMGIPLIATAFGPSGLIPVILIVAFHSVLLIGGTTLWLETAQGGRGGFGPTLAATARSLLGNPVMLGMAAGVGYCLTGLGLWAPVDRFTQLLSHAAAPCALFALGATVAGFRLGGRVPQTLFLVGCKMLLHPALVFVLSTWVFAVDPVWAAIATIAAALPTGANVFILARRYDAYVDGISSAILLSTGLSIGSLALLLAMLGPTR
ncbi:MAG: AEC family transporter [Alphaproteobacteria bacterium]|nr:AEC family transporter [Alphaproteobacteria bacterium]